jgi:hypothetical protein
MEEALTVLAAKYLKNKLIIHKRMLAHIPATLQTNYFSSLQS